MRLMAGPSFAPIKTKLTRWCYGLLDRIANGRAYAAHRQDLGGLSLRSKVMMVVLITTCLALLLSAGGLLIYELRAHRMSRLNDLQSQAEIIARASLPALSLKDVTAATQSLHMLQLRPQIKASAVYQEDGRLFAHYLQPDVDQTTLPRWVARTGHAITDNTLELFHPIRSDGEQLGVLYLREDDALFNSQNGYVLILLAVMATSTTAAALITARLQRTVTEPILQIAQVARNVMAHRDFSLRATKTSSDEVGQLVDAFNNMLAEVQARTNALEESNHQLCLEMGERRKAEEALLEASRKKDEFLATLAHELRNPLAPISSALEVVRNIGERDSLLRRRSLDIMSRQLKQLVRIIDDLLDVSRLTTGKLVLHKSRTDLVDILNAAMEIAAPQLESGHHVLDVRLPDKPVYLYADATRLGQVFANLLNNAAKYTADGGLISLRMQVHGDEAEVSVQDNGIGIPESMRNAVFEMFVQVDPSDRSQAGLGVGLALARRLAEMHGGSLKLRNEADRRGSEFIVRLPLATATQNGSKIDVGHAECRSESPPQIRR